MSINQSIRFNLGLFSFRSSFRNSSPQGTPFDPKQKDTPSPILNSSDEQSNFDSDNFMSTETPSRKHLHLDLDPNFVENAVMTCPLVPSAMLPTPNAMPGDLDVEPSDIRRLMGAVSFGYGIFQLCSSLLPPKILKIFNFLGFVGVQSAGISCLMYSRSTNDVRSVMAT